MPVLSTLGTNKVRDSKSQDYDVDGESVTEVLLAMINMAIVNCETGRNGEVEINRTL
jgi:hypothetical protein